MRKPSPRSLLRHYLDSLSVYDVDLSICICIMSLAAVRRQAAENEEPLTPAESEALDPLLGTRLGRRSIVDAAVIDLRQKGFALYRGVAQVGTHTTVYRARMRTPGAVKICQTLMASSDAALPLYLNEMPANVRQLLLHHRAVAALVSPFTESEQTLIMGFRVS